MFELPLLLHQASDKFVIEDRESTTDSFLWPINQGVLHVIHSSVLPWQSVGGLCTCDPFATIQSIHTYLILGHRILAVLELISPEIWCMMCMQRVLGGQTYQWHGGCQVQTLRELHTRCFGELTNERTNGGGVWDDRWAHPELHPKQVWRWWPLAGHLDCSWRAGETSGRCH